MFKITIGLITHGNENDLRVITIWSVFEKHGCVGTRDHLLADLLEMVSPEALTEGALNHKHTGIWRTFVACLIPTGVGFPYVCMYQYQSTMLLYSFIFYLLFIQRIFRLLFLFISIVKLQIVTMFIIFSQYPIG